MVKVLVVDDTEFFQKLYADELKKAGFEVEVASDGHECLEKMRKSNPRLVFMDIVMPKRDGMEALADIKADSALKNIPVVMLTSLSSEAKGEDSLLQGAVAYLVKTAASPEDVVKKAEEILGTSKAPLDPHKMP